MAGIDGVGGGRSDGWGSEVAIATGARAGDWTFQALVVLGLTELAICFYGAPAQSHHRITNSYGTALAQALCYVLASWLVL